MKQKTLIPRVSVVMAVFNGEPYLAATVQSVLNQTYRDFEFIVIDDGSVDGTWETLTAYAQRDARIVLLRNQPNVGVVLSLNQGLDRSAGQFIARQDADDLSHPERLQRQLAFLDSHPDYGMVAAVPSLIGADDAPLPRSGWDATQNDEIQRKLLDHMCLCGPTILVRRECLKTAGFYFSPGLDASEDYDLCLRISEVTKLASLEGGWYFYRQHPNSASRTREQKQMLNKAIALERALRRRYGGNPPQDYVALVARDYLHAAVIGVARDDLAGARHALACALEHDPAILDANEPLDTLIRAYTPSDTTQNALAYAERVYEDLLPRSQRLSRLRRRFVSDLHMKAFFALKLSEGTQGRWSHARAGIFHNPRWLINRGVISILLQDMCKHKRLRRHGHEQREG